MRLLIANPNTSQALTDRLMAAAVSVAAPTTELRGLTAPRGFPYIATRAEATLAGGILLDMLAAHAADADAVVVAAFGDPGLAAARELLAVPVVGMAEAAMLTACMLGRRFAIVTFTEALVPWFQDCVEHNGLAGRFAGFCVDPEGFARIEAVQEE
ncbi:MAG TPA: aspartate/glutamate racemase family protein, partial [Acetobacteraceae bacterium]|nr:aspartate/glutamate racemase family protein [Acetobacteraceae bacterium]